MLKWFISLSVTLLSLAASANVDLRVGDLLLQPLNCYSCNLIEDTEESIYSHMGIVMQVHPEVLVAEARGTVKIVSLKAFDSITEKGQKISVRRYRNSKITEELERNVEAFNQLFNQEFLNLKYDHDFLWDNFDEQGKEKIYCSELVAKLLQAFLGIDPLIKRMHYSRNYDQWLRYFRGNVPVGKWGNAPADYEKSDLFYEVGEL